MTLKSQSSQNPDKSVHTNNINVDKTQTEESEFTQSSYAVKETKSKDDHQSTGTVSLNKSKRHVSGIQPFKIFKNLKKIESEFNIPGAPAHGDNVQHYVTGNSDTSKEIKMNTVEENEVSMDSYKKEREQILKQTFANPGQGTIYRNDQSNEQELVSPETVNTMNT